MSDKPTVDDLLVKGQAAQAMVINLMRALRDAGTIEPEVGIGIMRSAIRTEGMPAFSRAEIEREISLWEDWSG